jgi:hypothetical protein
MTSPQNGAINQPLQVILQWFEPNESTEQVVPLSYSVEVSTASDFSNSFQTTIDTTVLTVPGLKSKTVYYWRVGANDKAGTNWASAEEFTTLLPVPVIPSLSLPTNNSLNQLLALTLSWGTDSTAATYAVQVSTTSSFGTTFSSQGGLTATSCPVTWLANSTVYYWQVNATNPGGTSAWSEVWRFTTMAPTIPGVPVLSAPTTGSSQITIPAALSWARELGATTYTLKVATVSNFSTTIYSGIGSAFGIAVSALDTDQTYYWQVNAGNAAGISAWSGAWSFSTISGPPAVPVQGSFSYSDPAALSWNPAAGASFYALQVSDDYYFSTTTLSQTGLTGSSFTLPANIGGGYWEVNASNVCGTSAWSSVWSFTESMCKSREVVGLVASADSSGDNDVQLPVTLSWTYYPGCGSSSGQARYTLQIATDSGFTSLVVNTRSFTITGVAGYWWNYSYTTDSLNNGTTYYWRIRQGSGQWSSVRSFTVIISGTKEIAAALKQISIYSRNEVLYYRLTVPDMAEISLYDIAGRKTVLLNRLLPAGTYSLSLRNSGLAHGLYVLHFKAGILDRRVKFVLSQ